MTRTALLLFASVAGCSGAIASIELEDASPGSPGSDAGPVEDATVSDSGAVPRDTGVPIEDARPDARGCERLRLRIDELRKEVLTCCPFCGALQCTAALDDLCCPLSTSKGGQTVANDFSAAVKEYKARCGPIACPAVPCKPAPSNDCDPLTSQCR
jgi:hypothetical protein